MIMTDGKKQFFATCDACGFKERPLGDTILQVLFEENWRINMRMNCICPKCGDKIGADEFLRRWPNPS